LRSPEGMVVELSAASVSEQGKRKARESWLGRAPRGGRGRMGPGSCVGAAETGASQAVSDTVREQGSGAARVGRACRHGPTGEGRS
jgi:hypothetical protein